MVGFCSGKWRLPRSSLPYFCDYSTKRQLCYSDVLCRNVIRIIISSGIFKIEISDRILGPRSTCTCSCLSGIPNLPNLPEMDMLSTRSYLELGGLQPSQHRLNHHSPGADTPESSPATEKSDINLSPPGKSAPRSAKLSKSNSEKTVTVGHPRKRGRPRLETTKDAAAIEVSNPGEPVNRKDPFTNSAAGAATSNPSGATDIQTEERGNHPGPQNPRRTARTDPAECIRSDGPRARGRDL